MERAVGVPVRRPARGPQHRALARLRALGAQTEMKVRAGIQPRLALVNEQMERGQDHKPKDRHPEQEQRRVAAQPEQHSPWGSMRAHRHQVAIFNFAKQKSPTEARPLRDARAASVDSTRGGAVRFLRCRIAQRVPERTASRAPA